MNRVQYDTEVKELTTILRKRFDPNVKVESHDAHGVCTTFEFRDLSAILNLDIDPWEKQYGFWQRNESVLDVQGSVIWMDTRAELLELIKRRSIGRFY